MSFDYKRRLKSLRATLKKSGLESILVTNETNVRYLSGFKGGDSFILVTPDTQFFLTDSRYTEEAKSSIKGFIITEVAASIYDTLGNIVKKNRIRKIGFESMNLPYEAAKRLESHVGAAKLIRTINVVEKIRSIKDPREIDAIKRSIGVTVKVLKKIVKSVRPGVSEKHLSGLIEQEFIANGARTAFDAIAAHGKNCSKPHAHPTDEKIAGNDIVMLDIGCRLDFYNSDITRMVLIGKVKDKIKEIYGIVSSAQKRAIDMIAPGVDISRIDSAGRDFIESKGYGKFFGHSMGHGVGMDVHEEPSISKNNKGVLSAGMIFTVEPAIYLPGIGGVRIEDMVLVTDKGCKILTI